MFTIQVTNTKDRFFAEILSGKKVVLHCGSRGGTFKHKGESYIYCPTEYMLPEIQPGKLYKLVEVETVLMEEITK